MSLPIGEVARLSGLSPDTLRFHERDGLLPAPARTSGGARRYDPAALDQLRVITALRQVGFGLDQVRDVLSAKSSGDTARARVLAARASIDRLEALLALKEQALREAREQLHSWRTELDSGEPWPDTPLPS